MSNLFQCSKAVKTKNITLSSMTCLFRRDVIVTKELLQNLLGNPDDKFLLVIFVLLVHKVVFPPFHPLLTAGINSYNADRASPYNPLLVPCLSVFEFFKKDFSNFSKKSFDLKIENLCLFSSS